MKFKTIVQLASALLALSLMPVIGFAEDHSLSTIQGTEINLKVYDHAMAGSIKDFLVWGNMDEETFSSELIMKKDGQIIRAAFKKLDTGKIGGTIKHEVDSKVFLTELYFVKLDKQENKLILNANGEEIAVQITADEFENGHFKNPTYKTTVAGKEISYTLQGSACYGYSLHLAFLILGAYLH